MKTYSKRQKRRINSDEDHWAPVADTYGHKTSRKSYANNPSNKKQKLDKTTMVLTSSPFETPYPTAEALSQAYKLPSSKPQSNFTPFSPVPKQPAKDVKYRGLQTASRNEKENSRNQRDNRSLSKTLSSSLKADLRELTDSESGNEYRSRPSSRASSMASSRMSSPQQQNEIKVKYSKLSRKNRQRAPHGTHSSSARPRKTALASPFVSRASSPVQQPDETHTAISTLGTLSKRSEMKPPPFPTNSQRQSRRPGLSDAQFDPNIPSRVARSSFGSRSQIAHSASTTNLPERNTRPNHASESSRKDKALLRDLQRRPSAPSSLQRFAKAVSKPFVASKLASKLSPPKAIEPAPDAEPVAAPIVSRSDGSKSEPLAWMNSRSDIDFNRPPSSMSVLYGFGRDGAGADEEDAVFTSSEEEFTDDDDDQGQEGANSTRRRFGRYDFGMKGEEFAEGVPFASTPFKALGLRLVEAFGATTHEPDVEDDEDDEDQDMELTMPLEGLNAPYLEDEDHTPWLTDSLISIPTAYLERDKKLKSAGVTEQNGIEDEPFDHHSGLSSPFQLPNIDTESSPSRDSLGFDDSSGLTDGKSATTGSTTVQSNIKTSGVQRARSGTIVAPKPVPAPLPPAARRTRTGTIVGPAPQIPSLQGQQAHATLANARRTRSGTIVGPLAPPTGRARSGSIMRATSLPVPVVISQEGISRNDGIGGGTVDGSDCALEGNQCPMEMPSHGAGVESLEEVDEFEGCADSIYAPNLASSPDPIDFLGVPQLIKEEYEIELSGSSTQRSTNQGDRREMLWCVADEPPSPQLAGENGSGSGTRRNDKNRNGRRRKAGRHPLKFMTPGGRAEEVPRLDVGEEDQDDSDGDLDVGTDELNIVG